MALEPGPKSVSPLSSGRSSPTIRRSRGKVEEDLYKKDKNYRRYASGVERALSLFDTALQEWADYISFLGRLLKALQAHPPNVVVIPLKTVVAKRLAQSLDPKLPSGVHQKALEVYAYIFSLVDKDTLAHDLPIYFPGLSPTLSFASLAVRPAFLALLESHLLPLNHFSLRAALKAIILALLPGLEEETSEDFERTLRLLEGFKDAVKDEASRTENVEGAGDDYFWQCFFLASITSPSRRQGALAFLARKLPKLGDKPAAAGEISPAANSVVSPEPGLLIRCFATGLSDDQLLVQRGFLDLLVSHLPLHSLVLQKRVNSEDLDRLLAAAAGVVVRRDMSLNRRLYTWFLGPEPSSETGSHSTLQQPMSAQEEGNTLDSATVSAGSQYFEKYGLQPLVRGIRGMINQNHKIPTDRARPFRICQSLMDRGEVGNPVTPEIFLPIINSVRQFKDIAETKEQFNEVLRSARSFFDGVESGLIWGELAGLIASAVTDGKGDAEVRLDKLKLVKFVVTHFRVTEEEMLVIHMPMVALALLIMVKEADAVRLETTERSDDASDTILALALSIAQDMIAMVPERAFLMEFSAQPPPTPGQLNQRWTLQSKEILESIRRFYVLDHGNLEFSGPPFSAREIGELLLREVGYLVSKAVATRPSDRDHESRTKLLVTLLSKKANSETLKNANLFSAIRRSLVCSSEHDPQLLPFPAFSAINGLVCALYAKSYLSDSQMSELIPPLVRQAWSHISPSNPKHHLETVRCLWQLQSAKSLVDRRIESAIATIMIEKDTSGTHSLRDAQGGRTFAILWAHSIQGHGGLEDSPPDPAQVLKGGVHSNDRQGGMRAYEYMLTRPLFLLLDALGDEGTELFVFARGWLQNLSSIDKIFHMFVSKFLTFDFLRPTDVTIEGDEIPVSARRYSEEDDIEMCIYYLQTLSNILRWSSNNVWTSMAQELVKAVDSVQGNLLEKLGYEQGGSFQALFVEVCMRAVTGHHAFDHASNLSTLTSRISKLHRVSLSVLHQILLSPYAPAMAELELENRLIQKLILSIKGPDAFVQVSLLDVLFAALKLRYFNYPESRTQGHHKTSSKDASLSSRLSLTIDRGQKELLQLKPGPPSQLVKCLQGGFSSTSSRPVLDSWINFLTECLPLFSDVIFQILIPLVECLCNQISEVFEDLKTTFKDTRSTRPVSPESTLIALLNGLEQILAAAHERLVNDEQKSASIKGPEQPQGFFGNMVSGVFASEAPQSRSATANNRLTVLLSFQDTVRICFAIWSWRSYDASAAVHDTASLASFAYTSLRMRNRARRILEHLFAAETLECLETLVEIWIRSSSVANGTRLASVFSLLHVLDGSRPKHTIPAIFNAIYSRTNPHALEPMRKSTLTSDLADVDIVAFLVEYARSLEDDTMDEIWTDCLTFLRDVLANPFPHRHTLPRLLEFTAILGEKVDNTNFGEQRKMRKDLGELFVRLLSATFTTKPMGFTQDSAPAVVQEKNTDSDSQMDSAAARQHHEADDIVAILADIVPNLAKILVDNDRVLGVATSISTGVIGPTFRAKSFPQNVTNGTLDLLYQLAKVPSAQKSWKKDISDAFNDSRIFASPTSLVESNWFPLFRQWALSNKECIPELLSRISPPTTAGLVFGVGASSARQEADRKAQLNLRRIAVLILAADEDTFIVNVPGLEEKVVELLTATAVSSPSSTTRAEVYMVLRALILKISPVHLAPLWPIINYELQAAILSVLPASQSDIYNNATILQACKLLDTLLVIAPDEFQLHEWLFITDTIDAVYRPAEWSPVALVDEVSEELGSVASLTPLHHIGGDVLSHGGASKRRPLLGLDVVRDVQKDDLLGKVLRPFFSQLSIYTFESTYSMGPADWKACADGLLADLFDEATIVA